MVQSSTNRKPPEAASKSRRNQSSATKSVKRELEAGASRQFSDFLPGQPESEGPGCHSGPTGQEPFVEGHEPLLTDRLLQAVHGRPGKKRTW